MKLLLGIDLTDKHNDKIDGEPFITRRLSEPLEREYDRLCAEEEQFKKKSSLPSVLRVIRWIAGMTTIGIPCILLESCSENSRNNNKGRKHNEGAGRKLCTRHRIALRDERPGQ